MKDLASNGLIWLKAILLLIGGCVSAVLLLVRNPEATTALLLIIAIWSFSRAYYFAFYVIERYIDRSYRFSGLVSFVLYVIRVRRAIGHESERRQPASDS